MYSIRISYVLQSTTWLNEYTECEYVKMKTQCENGINRKKTNYKMGYIYLYIGEIEASYQTKMSWSKEIYIYIRSIFTTGICVCFRIQKRI